MQKTTMNYFKRLDIWLRLAMPLSGCLFLLWPLSLCRQKALMLGEAFQSVMLWPLWVLGGFCLLLGVVASVAIAKPNARQHALGVSLRVASLSIVAWLLIALLEDISSLWQLIVQHGQMLVAASLFQQYLVTSSPMLFLWLGLSIIAWITSLWMQPWENSQRLLTLIRTTSLFSPCIILLPLPLWFLFIPTPAILLSTSTFVTLSCLLVLFLGLHSLYMPPKKIRSHVAYAQTYLEGLLWLGIGLVMATIVLTLLAILFMHKSTMAGLILANGIFKTVAMTMAPGSMICVAGLFALAGLRRYQYREIFTKAATERDSVFGSADYASQKDLQGYGFYDDKSDSIISGQDDKGRYLYLPLQNKLTISPAGGGKTTTSSIPVLLSYDGPVFVFDVKAELWATTARHRHEVFGRDVIVIDPYRITKSQDFSKGKPQSLLKDYHINPFDFIPENLQDRDRMLNAFASSFIINEGGTVKHFDENAKILVRGYIDYMMQDLPAESRTMSMLFQLLSEDHERAALTFQRMQELPGRASAAATQIGRVGADERGSILSTSYRQIDWMSDSNVQTALADSNFHLPDFLKGNMDIYIVLPEDQVVEHSRLVRMIMSLIKSMVVQANPSDLPKKKILCLLDELAQLGYCPDVEQFIEVMRARGLVMWMVFQTLNQIEQFQKPDLIKSATIKQIFTNDDVPTMEWLQKLAGKRTALSKSVSKNKGTTSQSNNMFGGSSSKGEGEGMQETAADLIQLNEIRELPQDEQWLFMQGKKPIRCKKVRYFECHAFTGKFDDNPVERYV